jgi:predicted kinase
MGEYKPNLYILQGVPGCGKSTYARTWQAADPANRVIVNRDGLRDSRGEYWIPAQEVLITDVEHHMIRCALNRGFTVMVDATNFNEAKTLQIEAMADVRGIEHVRVLFHETLEECLKRNDNPDRKHHVDRAVVENFYIKYINYCRDLGITPNPGTIQLIECPYNSQSKNLQNNFLASTNSQA